MIAVAVVVGGTAATVELVCAPRNHPEYVAKIEATAVEAKNRWSEAVSNAKGNATDKIERINAKRKTVKTNVFDYIYRQHSAK